MTSTEWQYHLLDGPNALTLEPQERALLAALLARPGVAIDFYTLAHAVWVNDDAPEGAEGVLRERVRRLRRELERKGYNPNAIVNKRPLAYGISLEALTLKPVFRPRYILAC